MANQNPELDQLRQDIDRIDRTMHELLMERGTLIAALQEAKGLDAPRGSGAMRPARETRMMKAIAERHSGPLPLIVAERIWREIIAAFTQLQAGFDVYAAGADDAALATMTDFYFGVTTPVSILKNPNEVLVKVRDDERAVGLIAGSVAAGDDPWWLELGEPSNAAARVVARYPIITDRSGNPWDRECWIVSQAPFDASGNDRTLVKLRTEDKSNIGDLAEAGFIELDRRTTSDGIVVLAEINRYMTSDEVQGLTGPNVEGTILGGYGLVDPGMVQSR